MKKLLKKVLSKTQRERLAHIKHHALSVFEISRKWIARLIIRMLSEKSLIYLKESAVIRKKMDYKKNNIYLHVDSMIEYDVRLRSCNKEPEMIEWIHSYFKPGDVFYDIGANVGAYSLVASKSSGGKVKAYAFEPGFLTFPQLCKNIILNNCQESIFPLQIAISDKTGIEQFNYNNLIPGGALHALGDAVDYKGDRFIPVFKQPVVSFRLDDIIKQFSLPVPSHIKIDVDGIELKILQGAVITLQNSSVKSLIIETENNSDWLNKIYELLKLKGFFLHSRHMHTEKMGNYLFIRETANGC